jgi:hypothetical protein
MKYRIIKLAKEHYVFYPIPLGQSPFYEYALQYKWLCFWLIDEWCHSIQEARDLIERRKNPSRDEIVWRS